MLLLKMQNYTEWFLNSTRHKMVSTKTKAGYMIGKTAKAGRVLLPIFAKESVSDFTKEILREDEYIRNAVMSNPEYQALLEQQVAKTFKDYRGIITGSKVVDSWDRVTSSIGLAGQALNVILLGAGEVLSQGEEIIEEIPKAIYAIYYGAKTKDWKALPYWTALEAASHIPLIGDAIDFTNIYVNRARKITKEKAKKEFRKMLPSQLELKAA